MKTSAALALAGIGIVFGVFGWLRGSSASLPGLRAAAEATPEAKQVVVHEHRYVGLPTSGATSASPKAPEEAAPEPATVHAAERRPVDVMEYRFQLESAFDDDQPPTRASRALEATILKGFASPVGKGATVNSLDCKATHCRLEVTFDDKEKDRDVIRGVFMRSTDMDLAGTVVERTTGPDGRIRALIYLRPTASTPSE